MTPRPRARGGWPATDEVSMARVVRFDKTGDPDVLKIEDVTVPPARRGEVRIRVMALGLNRAESMWRRGQYIEDPVLPSGIGYEAAGVVESVGPGVEHVSAGDVVSVVPGFSMRDYTMYGELVLAPAAMVFRHSPVLSFVEAASIWMMFLTAYGALVETARPPPGSFVLLPAASSSVGLAAIQIVNALGAIPIALTRTSAKRRQLIEAGAKYVVATDETDVAREIRLITDGEGASVVFDPVAGPLFATLLGALSERGTYVMYGALSDQPTTLPVLDVLAKLPTIVGYTIWGTTSDPVRLKSAVAYVLNGLESGALRPVVDRTFAFDDIVEAHRHLEANTQFGKIIVTL